MDSPTPPNHHSGFVCLIGKPNVGKSTLLNALLDFKLSIVTPKPSTTRHRILGILSADDYQAVLLDTPGIIQPKYKLHDRMMDAVDQALGDADLVLLLIAPAEAFPEQRVFEKIRASNKPVLLVINKLDIATEKEISQRTEQIMQHLPLADSIAVSALKGTNIEALKSRLKEMLPLGPAYYPKDQLTDRTERFFVTEIIREKIFLLFQEEIPYSTEVTVLMYEEREDGMVHIEAEIHVERQSQKGMLIGKQGAAIKQLGTDARADIEIMLDKKVFLSLYVRLAEDWKRRDHYLNTFGYPKK